MSTKNVILITNSIVYDLEQVITSDDLNCSIVYPDNIIKQDSTYKDKPIMSFTHFLESRIKPNLFILDLSLHQEVFLNKILYMAEQVPVICTFPYIYSNDKLLSFKHRIFNLQDYLYCGIYEQCKHIFNMASLRSLTYYLDYIPSSIDSRRTYALFATQLLPILFQYSYRLGSIKDTQIFNVKCKDTDYISFNALIDGSLIVSNNFIVNPAEQGIVQIGNYAISDKRNNKEILIVNDIAIEIDKTNFIHRLVQDVLFHSHQSTSNLVNDALKSFNYQKIVTKSNLYKYNE